MESYWWVFAIFFSLIGAGYALLNEYLKIKGVQLVFWRGVVPAILLSPLLFFMPLPSNPWFYVVVIATAAIACVHDAVHFNGVSKFGGGVTLRVRSVSVWVAFLLWFIVSPEHALEFLETPVRAGGAIVSLIVAGAGLFVLRKCEVSRAAFKYMIPVIITGSVLAVLNKTAMELSPFHTGVVYYIWVQAIFIAIFSFVYQVKAYGMGTFITEAFTSKVIWGGVFMGIMVILTLIAKGYAITLATNPAYVMAIAAGAPFWVIIFYRLKGKKEKANVVGGVLFVIGAVGLILATK